MAQYTRLEMLTGMIFPQKLEAQTNKKRQQFVKYSIAPCFPKNLNVSTLFGDFNAENVIESFKLNEYGRHSYIPLPKLDLCSLMDSEEDVKDEALSLYIILEGLDVGIKYGGNCFRNSTNKENSKVFVQHKCRAEMEDMPIESTRIIKRYQYYMGKTNIPPWIVAVSQCVSYLIHNKCRFIILTTYTFFYVIHIADDENGNVSVHITDRISTTTHIAEHAKYVPRPNTSSTCNLLIKNRILENSSFTTLDNTKINESEIVYTLALLHVIHKGFTGTAYTACPEMTYTKQGIVLNENLSKIGEGRSGVVYKTIIENVECAVKTINPWTNTTAALDRELYAFNKFSNAQGIWLPKIYHSSVITAGGFLGFAMELLSPLPWYFEEWNDEQRRAAKETLIALANEGLFQVDIRAPNFGINSENRIVMFDLEDVRLAEEFEDLCAYKTRYLKNMENGLVDNNLSD